jgi:hypothetical protein
VGVGLCVRVCFNHWEVGPVCCTLGVCVHIFHLQSGNTVGSQLNQDSQVFGLKDRVAGVPQHRM